MRRFLLTLAVAGVLLAVPVATHAASFLPLVPCGSTDQPDCTPCMLFATVKNVIDLILYGVTGPVAAFMIVIAGGMMLLGGGNPSLYGQGKKMLTDTLIGVTIILLSWTATSFLLHAVAKDEATSTWYTFSCPAFLQDAKDVPLPGIRPSTGSPDSPNAELVEAYGKACDAANLSKAYGTSSSTTKNAPSLDTLISCIKQDAVLNKLIDTNQVYTYERNNPLCNVSRGQPVCGGRCAHSMYSCHYGGHKGSEGAMGVDFNWSGQTVTYDRSNRTIITGDPPDGVSVRTVSGETGLFDEIFRSLHYGTDGGRLSAPRCVYGLLNFENDHTHMSTSDCDSDRAKGVRGRGEPSR